MSLTSTAATGHQVPFEIVREAWCDFELSDETRLRIRPILMKAILPEAPPKKTADAELAVLTSQKVLIVVLSPQSLRGPKNPQTPSVEQARLMKQEERQVVSSSEKWSLYRLPSMHGFPEVELRARISITSVFRVIDLWNEEGDPYYLVNYSTLVGPSSNQPTAPPKSKPRGKSLVGRRKH